MKLPDKLYDTLKWITMVLLPALAAFYISLAKVWNLPMPTEVSATIGALVVFLGVFLQINSAAFKSAISKELIKSGFTSWPNFKFLMTDTTYDTLKWIATIFLPAVSTLYLALAGLWNLPYGEIIHGTISAIVMFMAAMLQISSLEYKATMKVVLPKHQGELLETYGFLSMSSDMYDFAKFFSQGLLPGIATFYTALAAIWGLPYPDQVPATIMAIVLFMNTLLQISTSKFKAAQK